MEEKVQDRLAEIEALKPFGENESGQTHELENRAASRFMMAYRKSGSINGNHWHTGSEKKKNPEVLYVLTGKGKLLLKHIETAETEERTFEAPCEIKIYPKVLHTVQVIEDMCFLEMNSLDEHIGDTYYPE
jgi:oxalate decarboxylase/phosphoglucose isomerase-like protein (cupin superfamily)